MASAFWQGGKWWASFKDGRGRWRKVATTAHQKTDAKRIARELEAKGERQRLGLEPLPAEDGGGTVAELLRWWLTGPVQKLASREVVERQARHLLDSDLGRLTLAELTPGRIEGFLAQKDGPLAPETVNHLRGYLGRAFNLARRAGRWAGANPVADVPKRKVPVRQPDYLRHDEVVPVLEALREHGSKSIACGWRPLFATATYAGLRKGELCALRKTDVDFDAGILTVARSWERNTTKGGKVRHVPIHAELAPFLRVALAASPSDLVFPRPDGSMLPRELELENVLRRALGRAGIVLGWRHVCRVRGCQHSETAPDKALRRCPTHGHKLWPTAIVRPLRFHDLRHTTASLLMQSGCSPAAVQRILGHSDVKLTMDVYGHLAPGFLRDEIGRLTFGLPVETDVPPVPMALAAGFSSRLPQTPGSGENTKAGDLALSRKSPASSLERATGFGPATPSLGSSCSTN